jgi:hypothetical protein
MGWVVLGAVLGVVADHAATLHAQYLGLSQQRVFNVGDARGVFAEPRVIVNGQRYSFVKDSKSGGCWLKYEHDIAGNVPPAVALAVAPADACQ